VQQEVRRLVTEELLQAFRAGLRDDGGDLVSIVTPEVRGAALAGLMGTRASSTWPAVAAAGVPILLLLATEPEELRKRSEAAVPAFLERFPEADVRWIDGAGHDLFADAGPRIAGLIREWAARN
jgi:pimeloyl-ACP methyl ester carboxylesterase